MLSNVVFHFLERNLVTEFKQHLRYYFHELILRNVCPTTTCALKQYHPSSFGPMTSLPLLSCNGCALELWLRYTIFLVYENIELSRIKIDPFLNCFVHAILDIR